MIYKGYDISAKVWRKGRSLPLYQGSSVISRGALKLTQFYGQAGVKNGPGRGYMGKGDKKRRLDT